MSTWRRTKTSSSEDLARREPEPLLEAGADGAPAPPSRRAPEDRRRPLRIRSPHNETFLEACGDFAARVYKKADQDQIFFMAGSIAFNVLVAIIPLLLASLGIAGNILQSRFENPEQVLLGYVLRVIPPVDTPGFRDYALVRIQTLLAASSKITILGLVLLVWVSTRLVGTLRAALKEVFDVGQDRSIIMGKLFDMKMVVFAGTLFAANVALTFLANLVNGILTRASQEVLGEAPFGAFEKFYLAGFAILTAWIMFLLIYRYLPYRRIHWRTAIVAATFTTTLFEILKRVYAWYVVHVADYGSTYSNVANIIVLVLWVYYISIIFILGGEVGQVAALRRIRQRQKERLG